MATITPTIRDDARLAAEELDRCGLVDELRGTHLLLTGAAGFLGAFILDTIQTCNARLITNPIKVTAVDSFLTGLPARVRHLESDNNIHLVHGDVTKVLELESPADWIIHAASVASPSFYRRYPLETINTNVNGTWRLLERAITDGVRSFLHLSSSEIYGDPPTSSIPTSESYWGHVSCQGPRACYDESKRLAETLCMTMFRERGAPVRIVRPFNVYGPGQRLDDRRVMPDMLRAAQEGGPLVLLSDGRPTRSFCYLRDFIIGLMLVMVKGTAGDSYNLGNDEEVSMLDLARTVAGIATSPPLEVLYQASSEPDYLTDNPQRRCPDLTKITNELGWRPQVRLAEGIARSLSSYREETEGR